MIRNPRDGSRDYWLPEDIAVDLFMKGELSWDSDNQCFITRRRTQ